MDYLAEILKAEEMAKDAKAAAERKAGRDATKARKAGKHARIQQMMGNLSKVAVASR